MVQVLAPSVIAIADAWRMDGREAYSHIESGTGSNCVVVHHDDCALCAFINACGAPATSRTEWIPAGTNHATFLDIGEQPQAVERLTSRSRAPPSA